MAQLGQHQFISNLDKSGVLSNTDLVGESKTIAAGTRNARSLRDLDAGPFAADIASFRLNLAAENKAERTIKTYTEAVRWFAGTHLCHETDKTRWDQVSAQDVRRWMVHLLALYSDAYAYQQFRALQQFFRWLAAEEEIADPMARLRPPKVERKPVPYFKTRTCLPGQIVRGPPRRGDP
jgi:integrase